MFIGTARIEFLIEDAYSLKDKRRVIKGIMTKIQNKFNASIAEIDCQEIWNKAVLGVACVSNSSAHADSMIQNIVNFIEKEGWVEIIHFETEIL